MLIFINHLLLYVGGDGLGLVLFLSKMEILCRLIHSVENAPTIFPDVDLDLVLLSWAGGHGSWFVQYHVIFLKVLGSMDV